MIHDYAADIASQIGIQKLRVSVTNGIRLGCRDMHLVDFMTRGKLVSELLHHSELELMRSGVVNERVEQKIRSALERLKLMLDT